MPTSFLTYRIKIFTLVLLGSFILPNVSLCYALIENCKSENVTASCCCEVPDDNDTNCCCEITDRPQLPLETPKSLNEIFQKSFTLHSKIFSDAGFIINKHCFINNLVASFHSPPKEDIYIINSNFRI